jgi:3-isopropylmalate/(R)-2-methylmalate dehydratase small subunit
MTALELQGRARVISGASQGDDINTDYIITSRRKRESLDPQVLRQYLFEEIDPGFAGTVTAGDIIVAGKNFGCGSAMEVAATAILGAGIRAVLARSFSRTYYRNAINNGLLPVMCDTHGIHEGDRIEISHETEMIVRNITTGATLTANSLPQIMLDIFEAGGLVPYFRQHGDFRV